MVGQVHCHELKASENADHKLQKRKCSSSNACLQPQCKVFHLQWKLIHCWGRNYEHIV